MDRTTALPALQSPNPSRSTNYARPGSRTRAPPPRAPCRFPPFCSTKISDKRALLILGEPPPNLWDPSSGRSLWQHRSARRLPPSQEGPPWSFLPGLLGGFVENTATGHPAPTAL